MIHKNVVRCDWCGKSVEKPKVLEGTLPIPDDWFFELLGNDPYELRTFCCKEHQSNYKAESDWFNRRHDEPTTP